MKFGSFLGLNKKIENNEEDPRTLEQLQKELDYWLEILENIKNSNKNDSGARKKAEDAIASLLEKIRIKREKV